MDSYGINKKNTFKFLCKKNDAVPIGSVSFKLNKKNFIIIKTFFVVSEVIYGRKLVTK